MAGRAIVRKTIGVTGFGNGSVQEAFSSANPTKSAHKHLPKSSNLPFLLPNASSTTVFASSSSSSSLPVAANPSSCFCDDCDNCDNCDNCDGSRLTFVADRGKRERKLQGICSKCVFGSVPSKGEVDDALSALLQAVAPYSCSETTQDGSNPSSGNAVTDQIAATASVNKLSSGGPAIEPAVLHFHNQRVLQSYGSKNVSDAFHLLRSKPSIQRMVVSLCTDKAVWDAILNNEVVREFIEKPCIADQESAESSEKGPGAATWISECVFHLGDWFPWKNLFGAEKDNAKSSEEGPGAAAWFRSAKWVLNNMKILVVELTEKIIKLLIEASKPVEGGKSTSLPVDHLEDALGSSLLLTVLLLLIVIVSRAYGI